MRWRMKEGTEEERFTVLCRPNGQSQTEVLTVALNIGFLLGELSEFPAQKLCARVRLSTAFQWIGLEMFPAQVAQCRKSSNRVVRTIF